jgi:small-conductance mechanosensitive channel
MVPVDLQEKRQLDLAAHVAKVKSHTRPWRSIIALVLAIASAVVAYIAGQNFSEWTKSSAQLSKLVAAAATAAFCLFAIVAVVGFAAKSRDVMQPVTGRAHAAVVRYTIVMLGGIASLFIALALLKVPINQLLVGGAVTSIILGIAAQQSLGNVFSGVVLLLSHPFGVGDDVYFRAGAFSGQIEGTVTEIGISYVVVETADGPVHLPNSQVLAAAVGPVRPDKSAGPAGQDAPSGQAGQAPTQATMGNSPPGPPPA